MIAHEVADGLAQHVDLVAKTKVKIKHFCPQDARIPGHNRNSLPAGPEFEYHSEGTDT